MAQYRLYEQGGSKDTAELDKAIASLSTAAQLAPADAEIRYQLGTLRRKKGDNSGAVADLELATKLVDAQEQKLQKEIDAKKGDTTAKTAELAKLKQTEASYWNNVGVAYRANKRDDDAIAAYKKAIAAAPNDASYHFNLAVALRRKTEKDPDQIPAAIAEYEKATGLDPGNADAWFDLGFMYKTNHENDKAIGAFNKYLELNKGKDPEADKRIADELGSMGAGSGSGKKEPPKKPTPKKK
jgi:Flp pilus assembly protein TadD